MPFVGFPNGAEAELRYTQDGQAIENVLHFIGDAAFTATDLTNLASDLKTWWNANLKAQQAGTVSLREIVCRDLTSATAPSISYTTGLPISGTGAGSNPPQNVTAAVKLLTQFSGRSFRGRVYHVGLVNSMLSGNSLTAGTVTALLAAYNALRTVVWTSNNPSWAVFSKFTLGAPRAVGVMSTILNVGINAICDSQRRRLPERGA